MLSLPLQMNTERISTRPPYVRSCRAPAFHEVSWDSDPSDIGQENVKLLRTLGLQLVYRCQQ